MTAIDAPVLEQLRDFVLAALEDDEPSPHKVAAVVADMLPDELLRPALAETLHHYVRVIDRLRVQNREPSDNNGSPKWAQATELREAVELLRLRVYARGDWKLLADCDEADCLSMAQMRERQATANAHKAKQYRVLAGALKQRKVGTVRELPADALEAIFSA